MYKEIIGIITLLYNFFQELEKTKASDD